MNQPYARILIVDDDSQIRQVLRLTLSTHGYVSAEARTGEEAIAKLQTDRFDLVLLDIGMPGMGGFLACDAIRESSSIPIIMLSVRSSEQDKVRALDAGADDYISKPFGTPELMARIRAALRRAPAIESGQPERFMIGDLEVNLQTRTVVRAGKGAHFTPKEFDLLQYFLTNPNVAVPHQKLLQAVWGVEYGDEVEYLRVIVNRLRKKIEPDPAKPRYLLTEPWVGYIFRASEDPTNG